MHNSVTMWLKNTAECYPNNIAIVDSERKITYGQYFYESTSIAYNIIKKIEGKNNPIVVFLEKGSKVLSSFMGVAMSGNFYSPIDIDMPISRIDKILDILRPKAIITSRKLLEKCKEFSFCGDILFYDDMIGTDVDENLVAVRENSIIDTDLLYVLFTSGSTGVPKGVTIAHGSVVDYIDWVTDTFKINESDRFANQAPFYFDNSILDIYTCMKTGATLYITPKNLFFQPVPLLEYLKQNGITTIFWVPSALMVVSKLKAFRNVDLSGILKRVMFCGEVMPNKQLNVWRKYLPDVIYANLYGPTEITDACTYYIVDREFNDEEPLPIGIPMRNSDILVLNDENSLVKGDEAGELCVRGVSLSKGYYRNIEKTNNAFVQNPLNDAYPELIYRTGDIVRYNERGELIYISRKDFQIKHLGHRIELGEIETAISSVNEVNSCCVLYDEKRSRIVAFIDYDMNKDALKEKIETLVPEYMIPGKVVFVENMPLTGNGKIDRIKLKELI